MSVTARSFSFLSCRAATDSVGGTRLISNRQSLLLSFATLLGLHRRLTCYLFLEPFLSRLLLDMVRLSLAQNVLEPELGALVVGLQMSHLSGIGTNAIALNKALFLGESDGSIVHTSFETVLRAAAVAKSVGQCLLS
jgi:hypothetical protein